MKNIKDFNKFNEGNIFLPYVPFDEWPEDKKYMGETLSGMIISKRIKNSMFGDKYLLGIKFDAGFSKEIEFDYTTYSNYDKGDRIRVEM